jgi:hypothetical protein
MIAVIIRVAMIFTGEMFVADTRRGKWFSEISNLHGARDLIFVN